MIDNECVDQFVYSVFPISDGSSVCVQVLQEELEEEEDYSTNRHLNLELEGWEE